MKNKNIWLLPTNKPSRLLLSKKGNLQFLKDNSSLTLNNHFKGVYQNIYITSDEEIKEGDWVIKKDTNKVVFLAFGRQESYNKNKDSRELFTKIILTTNQDLIKDGVQAIDDDFLEWFVKNPSCEVVEVEEQYFHGSGYYKPEELTEIQKKMYKLLKEYKIIIPKNEPKLTPEFQEVIDFNDAIYSQETLENKSDVISSFWVNADDRTPTENLWFICYADGVRQPLKFNKHNQFWVALAGKTYKPNEIERWLDA